MVQWYVTTNQSSLLEALSKSSKSEYNEKFDIFGVLKGNI